MQIVLVYIIGSSSCLFNLLVCSNIAPMSVSIYCMVNEYPWIILGMGLANGRRHYHVTPLSLAEPIHGMIPECLPGSKSE